MRFALELLRDDRLEMLLTGESAFEALPEAMTALAARPGNTLCHVVSYD
jgi:hypothetical protein